MVRSLNRSGECVMYSILSLNVKSKKRYCFPSQEKLVELLGKYYQVEISRRHLNRVLSYLETNNYIVRKRRISRDKKRGMVFRSTLYWLRPRAYRFLARVGKITSSLVSSIYNFGRSGLGCKSKRNDYDKREPISLDERREVCSIFKKFLGDQCI